MLSYKNHYKHALIFGSIAGGVIFFVLMLGFVFGSVNNLSLETFVYILFISGVVISVKRYRDTHAPESFAYKKAFTTAYITVLIIGFFQAVYFYILYKASPGLLDELLHEAQEKLLDMGMSEEYVLEAVSRSTPLSMAWGALGNTAIMGGILSLIVAAIFYRKPNPMLIENEEIN